jgi:DNA-binding GntR family transcriptional regulator
VAEPERVVGLRRVAARSLVELVLDEIRRSILDRSLVPGASVSIGDLADRLGVSHIPVREALRRIEAEGLVELRHGRSARVAPMSRDDLVEVAHLRALVEADAMARAAPQYTDGQLAAIERAWEGLLVEPGIDPEELFLRHRELHQLLVGPALGEWDRRLLEMLWRAAERYVALLVLKRDLSEEPTTLREAHRGLVEAAATRSPEKARKAVAEHEELAIDLLTELIAL